MKNRRIPFGYSMRKGYIQICEYEAETIRWIYTHFKSGSSLASLAKSLTDRQIEYLPGETLWNKCRVKRILEDTRYCGEKDFPPILRQEEYLEVQSLRAKKREAVDRTPCGGLRDFQRKVLCAACGQPMRHLYEKRNRSSRMRWCCTACGIVVKIEDEALLETVTSLLSALAAAPERLLCEGCEQKLQTPHKETDIRRMLSDDFDKEQMREKILSYAEEIYQKIDNTWHLSEVVKVELRKAVPLSTFPEALVEKIVAHIRLNPQHVSLELINGQMIGEEDFIQDDAADNAGEEGHGHSAAS